MGETTDILKKLMDACSMRHRVLSSNLANATTRGYVRHDVDFKDALSKAVKSEDASEVAAVKPKIVRDREAPFGENGNNVSSQKELGAIMENSMLYGVSAKVLSSKFATLRRAMQSK